MYLLEWLGKKAGMVTAGELDHKLEAAAEELKASTTFTMESLFLSGKQIIYGSGGGTAGAYSDSWVAHSCIKRLATDASGVPLKFLRDPDDPDSDLPESHPTVKLFKSPNPYFTTSEFVQWLVTTLQTRGEFFILFDDPLRPSMMYQYTEPMNWKELVADNRIERWEYRRGQEHHIEAPENLIHHRFIDPANPFRGQAPLQAAALAYGIDLGSDKLQRNIVLRGGERSVLFEAPPSTTVRQRAQALEAMKGRRNTPDAVAQDVILPTALKVVDPKFIEDDLKILESQKMQPDKICAVYGLSKSLLGIEDIDKYATFAGRIKVYFYQTLIPQLNGIEGAFDRFFVETARPSDACYVRFNYENVPALQDNIGEQFTIAGKAHTDGIPWSVLNERFRLGLDIDLVPGSDTVLVSSALAPMERLIAEWEASPDQPSSGAPPDGADDGGQRSATGGPVLTNALIEKRARNPRNYLQRQMRMFRYEKALRGEWKKTIRAAWKATGITAASIEAQRKPTKKAVSALTRPYHERGALEGETSIIELTEGKLGDEAMAVFKAKHKWRPEVDEWLVRRNNLISDEVIDDLFDDVKATAIKAVKEGQRPAVITALIKDRFHSANGGINRAVTIARTELGSAFNFARFTEMEGQGFEKHKWLTAGDELVRDDPFDHVGSGSQGPIKIGDEFLCGLAYPMEDGGEAGNVINCRCETIPTVEV
jgi:HK97 family phage portal protein